MLRLVSCLLICLLAATAQAKNDHGKDQRDLPPGLQKKLERTGELPPGWQRQYRRGDHLPDDIYARAKVVVPVGDDGRIVIDVEGVLMKLVERSHRILSISEPEADKRGKR